MIENKRLQQLGGLAAIANGLLYCIAFAFYGGLFTYPAATASASEKLKFLSDNQNSLSVLNLSSYVFFGILLTLLVIALHQRLKDYAPIVSKLTTVFGIVWVGHVIASGMIANVGLKTVIGMTDAETAMALWSSVSIISEGLGGGNEIVGGLWVLLLSVVALKGSLLSKSVCFLGIFVGLVGVITIYPAEVLTEIFGISQLLWFFLIGVHLLRRPIKH